MGLERELPAGLVVSGIALGIDAGILHALVAYAGWPVQAGAAAGFLAGLVANYLLSIRFVFSDHVLGSRLAEFVAFAGIGLGGLVLNAAVFRVVAEYGHLHHLVAKACAAAVTFCFNFGVRRTLLFSR